MPAMPIDERPGTFMRKKLQHIIIGRLLPAAAFAVVIAAVAGCESDSSAAKQPTQKEAATAQWNGARAAVLGGLAEDQFKTGNFEKSRSTIDQAIALDPKNPNLHLLSAKVAIENGQLELAERELTTAGTLDPKNAEVDYLSGVICQRWQKPEAAAQFYETAGEKNPSELAYVLARAEMMVAMDQRKDAIALLQEKMTYFEHSATIRDAVGELLVQEGQYPQAVETLREASILASDDPAIRNHLAMACFQNHDYREAADLFTRLLHDPAYDARAEVHLAHGECLMQLDRIADARTEFETTCRLDPASVQGWLGVAKTGIATGDLRRTELSIQRVQSIDPDSADAMLMLGYLRLKQERYPESMAAFRTASTLDRSDPVALCMMGYVLEKTGRSDQASPFFAKALRIRPDDELARKLMASLN
jgi:tetratricopeptide (TPR) repeat protein